METFVLTTTGCLCANYPGTDEDDCSCCDSPIGVPCPVDDEHDPAASAEQFLARRLNRTDNIGTLSSEGPGE